MSPKSAAVKVSGILSAMVGYGSARLGVKVQQGETYRRLWLLLSFWIACKETDNFKIEEEAVESSNFSRSVRVSCPAGQVNVRCRSIAIGLSRSPAMTLQAACEAA